MDCESIMGLPPCHRRANSAAPQTSSTAASYHFVDHNANSAHRSTTTSSPLLPPSASTSPRSASPSRRLRTLPPTISSLDASKAGLDPVALPVLVSFMAIALPLVPPSGIVEPELREAAEILMITLAREGEGVGMTCVRFMALQIDNP